MMPILVRAWLITGIHSNVLYVWCFTLHALQVVASPTEQESKTPPVPHISSHGIISFDSATRMSNTGSSINRKSSGIGVGFEEPWQVAS